MLRLVKRIDFINNFKLLKYLLYPMENAERTQMVQLRT